jgi:tetratricopeptide (TPR) repeat protein
MSKSGKENFSAMEDTAAQHFIIGDNLRHKAFYEDAIDEFHKALQMQQPLLGDDSPIVAKSMHSMGLALRAIKDYTGALDHLNKAISIFEAQEDSTEYETAILNCKLNVARTHHSQGVDWQRDGDYDKSIVEHRKSLVIRERLLGAKHLETARSYYVMGCALSDRGDFDEALSDLRRTFRTRLIIFGKDHIDTTEVVENLGVVLQAKGLMTNDDINKYKTLVVQSVARELEGDMHYDNKDFENAMVSYRKALSLEEQCLGDLHPTTCDLYLRMADVLGELGDFEGSLVEYKSVIIIYERLLGKFNLKVAEIYNKLANILMDKGEYETALSFYAKSYGIFDSILGDTSDTKLCLENVRLAATKERTASQSMDLIKKAEETFKERHPNAGDYDADANSKDNATESNGDANGKKSVEEKSVQEILKEPAGGDII